MSQTELTHDAVHAGERERPFVSVVVPVFNEERTVREVHKRTAAALDGYGRPWELIVIDDWSHDGTGKSLEEMHPDHRAAARALVEANRGARARTLAVIDELVPGGEQRIGPTVREPAGDEDARQGVVSARCS